jgi:hypothetical protein
MKISDWIFNGMAVAVIVVAGFAVFAFTMTALRTRDLPPAEAPRGTVERRLHLKLESPMDNDHPRKFVCREEP